MGGRHRREEIVGELNPVEHVWLYLRERFLSLRVLDDTDAVIDACFDAWNLLVAEPGRIKTLCDYPWIQKVASSTRWYESAGAVMSKLSWYSAPGTRNAS